MLCLRKVFYCQYILVIHDAHSAAHIAAKVALKPYSLKSDPY
jgi:hypothetical protein